MWELFDSAPDATLVVDARGRLVFVNALAERVFGYARSELVGLSLDTLIPGRFHAAHGQQVQQYLEKPRVRPMGSALRLVGKRKSGEEFPADIVLSPVDQDGEALVVATVRDLTVQATVAENRVRRDAARIEQMLDATAATVVRLNKKGRITYVNEAWRTFARANDGDLRTIQGVGLDYLAMTKGVRDPGATAVAVGLAELISGEKESFAVVYPCHSTTELRWFKLDAKLFGTHDAIILTHAVITDLYLAERRLEVQAAAAQALAGRLPLLDACRRIVKTSCEGMGWDFATIWEPGAAGRLSCSDIWAREGLDLGWLGEATRSTTFAPGQGLPGRVWASGKTERSSEVMATAGSPREILAAAAGMRAHFAVPVAADGGVFAVLEFSRRVRTDQEVPGVNLLTAIGHQLGDHLLVARGEHRFRQIIDAITDLVFVKGPDSRMIWANKAFRELYGMSEKQLQGMVDAPFEKPDHTLKYVRDDAIVFSTGKVVTNDEPISRADGRVLLFRTQKSPIFDDSGTVVMTVGVSHDITEQNRLATELQLAGRMASMGTLAAGIAHEINTPVQFVSDSVQFLKEASDDVFVLLTTVKEVFALAEAGKSIEEVKAALALAAGAREKADLGYLREKVPRAFERSLDGLERIGTIVRSMKEYAHPAQQEMVPADLNRAIQNTLTIARNEYKYVAELETDFGELPPVTCHVSDLNQVVLNLVVNAAHAIGEVVKNSGALGMIKVRTRLEGEEVVISIADTGAGISEANAHRIFEPFFTTKDVGKGTGQGLALAWAVVTKKHQGELTFESEVGKGTTFFVRIPVAGA